MRVEDRKNLPFTDAVIHEIQRLANIVPMAIPHKTARDVTLNGYFIKEVEFPHLFQEEKVNNVFFSAFTDIQCENYNSANPANEQAPLWTFLQKELIYRGLIYVIL